MLEQLAQTPLSQYVRARVVNKTINNIEVIKFEVGSIHIVDLYSKGHIFHYKMGMVEIILDSEDKPLPYECLELFV